MLHRNHQGKIRSIIEFVAKYIIFIYFRTAVPYYNQIVRQETDDDSEPAWKSLSTSEKQNYKRRRKEVSISSFE